MNRKHEKVRFHFVRKWALSGALLTCKLFINGEFVGSLKNGKTLDVDVPKSDYYYIDEMWAPDERNGVIRASDLKDANQIFVEIRRAGGWRTDSYNEFYVREIDMYVNLPSFDYARYYQACYDDILFSELTEKERILTLGLAFFNEVSDGADEVLYNERLLEMLGALQHIGAMHYLNAFTSIVNHVFDGITLPLNDEIQEDKDIQKRLAEANRIVWDSEKNNKSAEEFHKCIVAYITEHFLR